MPRKLNFALSLRELSWIFTWHNNTNFNIIYSSPQYFSWFKNYKLYWYSNSYLALLLLVQNHLVSWEQHKHLISLLAAKICGGLKKFIKNCHLNQDHLKTTDLRTNRGTGVTISKWESPVQNGTVGKSELAWHLDLSGNRGSMITSKFTC